MTRELLHLQPPGYQGNETQDSDLYLIWYPLLASKSKKKKKYRG